MKRVQGDGSRNLDAPDDSEDEARLRHKVHDGIKSAASNADDGGTESPEPFEWKPTPTKDPTSYFDNSQPEASKEQPEENSNRDAPPINGDKISLIEEIPHNASGPRSQHVLLVEDNKINQRLLSRKLENKGFKVTTASNGQEAVSRVKDTPSSGEKGAFDIILMDKEMPILDGNAATRQIRDLELRNEVQRAPIIGEDQQFFRNTLILINFAGVTANVRDEQQDEMLASGMDDIITKPYEVDEMVGVLNATHSPR